MNKNVKWVIHNHLIERALPTGRTSLVQALRHRGNEVVVLSYDSQSRSLTDLPTWDGQCVVAYGSVQFVNQIMRLRKGKWQPGAFLRAENLSYGRFSAFLSDLMLNDDFVILPFAEFKRRGLTPWRDSVFIRPDRVTKLFTGFTISTNEFTSELRFLEQTSHVMPDDMIVAASAKPILGEFRFIISEGEVVTGSAYSWVNTLDVRIDVHPAALEVAQEVGRREWQADRVYTCDVALTEIRGKQEARLLELNAFSCSGLYACDTNLIAEAVSQAAWNEFIGNDL